MSNSFATLDLVFRYRHGFSDAVVTNQALDKNIRTCHIERGLILTVAVGCEVTCLKILIIEDDVNIARLIELEL